MSRLNGATKGMVGGAVSGQGGYSDIYRFEPSGLSWQKEQLSLEFPRSDLASVITDTADVDCQ